ncbi:MAG TPA: sigma-54 dependent transcriptional regulator [Blastocatellia bacterium]|nr:sigma-54 dependent transcriptional regulator [Blastocatellia bacterium]
MSHREYSPLHAIIGESPAFISEIQKIPVIARSESCVLIMGETGTGKELCARAIHQLSSRSLGPYVAVNCAAIPVELAENELFGHHRGAFTSAASSQPGLVEAAGGGTLFLDEINSLPLQVQSKLLRFLQEKEYRPLGSTRVNRANVRVIAAANCDVKESLREGTLRRDLYYRLSVWCLNLPPLQERREDIPLLARHFLEQHSRQSTEPVKKFSHDALQLLKQYEWPGNVRELEHAVERAFVCCEQPVITAADLMQKGALPSLDPFQLAKQKVIEDFERKYLRNILYIYQGNISRAAEAAQKERSTFRRLLQKHGIDVRDFKLNGFSARKKLEELSGIKSARRSNDLERIID